MEAMESWPPIYFVWVGVVTQRNPHSKSITAGAHKYKERVTSIDGPYRSKLRYVQSYFSSAIPYKVICLKNSSLNDLIWNYGSDPRGGILKFASFRLPAPCIYGLLITVNFSSVRISVFHAHTIV